MHCAFTGVSWYETTSGTLVGDRIIRIPPNRVSKEYGQSTIWLSSCRYVTRETYITVVLSRV